ncbi:hypothetical protein GCM10011348_21880 [Marinobacterium nitratireducens]|uniref:Porin domain-containing protein n=1 Tax=Marinobacterium nitratireducens TaxID=518897 RepID=A0A917ZFL5_9GAMM|nr:porin [Marinobacterium nitratireducens]GGO81871.1 hypothetical protein GCM10011348_21880 [Marinobacterium nitratireducens]
MLKENKKNLLLTLPVVGFSFCSNAYAIDVPESFEYRLYGQINQILMFADDGEKSEQFISDNSNSASRLGVIGKVDTPEGFEIGARLEAGYAQNPSNMVTMEARTIDAEFKARQINLHIGGDFGKLTLGRTDGANNGNAESDLSGTTLALLQSPVGIGARLQFQDDGMYGPPVALVLNHQDFESRYDLIRYDTPEIGGAVISASTGIKDDNDVYEIGSKIKHKFEGGSRLSAGLGYSAEMKDGVADKEETYGGSVSWLSSNGFNVSLTATRKVDDDESNPDADYRSVKIGYKKGRHAVAAIYGQGSDQGKEGDDATYAGVGYLYGAAKWLQLYGAYTVQSLDRDGRDYDDINIAYAGVRIGF